MKKILVVDDDEDVLETIQLVLEIGGYDVEPLDNAERIFDAINNFRPDLILLDVVLGKIDGRSLTHQLKSSIMYKQIPILLMSALYNEQEILASVETAPDDFLPKPFKLDNFLSKIDRLTQQENHN